MISSSDFSRTNLFDRFVASISEYTGLVVKYEDRNKLANKILQRANKVKLGNTKEYYQYLIPKSSKNNYEWYQIIGCLTNNESYFFRDRAQIGLLKNVILPELIERRSRERTLRICSAGCSTGEEPYTLAIILQELLPNYRQWNLKIFGVDIDELAIEKAKLGIYPEWSFRGVELQTRQRYFQAKDKKYYLNSNIKRMVEFSVVNLVEDDFSQPHSNLVNIDLLICRNVFIYFNAEAIAKVINKFYGSLNYWGYLVTGHTEIDPKNLGKFKIKVFKEAIAYQRSSTEFAPGLEVKNIKPIKTSMNVNLLTAPSTKKVDLTAKNEIRKREEPQPESTTQNIDAPTTLQAAKDAIAEQQYKLALSELEKLVAVNKHNLAAYGLIAQIQANLHKYTEAKEYCQKILAINSSAVFPHYLLSQIAEEEGNVAAAKQLLKKIIYLDPVFADAYLDLSQIYQAEGDTVRSRKMQQAALTILKRLPPDKEIEHRNNLTVRQIIDAIDNG